MTEPTTDAGKALEAWIGELLPTISPRVNEDILAIEQQARADLLDQLPGLLENAVRDALPVPKFMATDADVAAAIVKDIRKRGLERGPS